MNSINIESRIVLGRPETGNDKALITDLPISQVEAIGEWIRANVSPSRTKYCGTSYGMKHGFESDTGIYLTNNQFKDAMLLAGYYPANEYALNWEYFIELKKINNPNPFREWLKLRLDDDDIEIRHFAHDVIYDTEFPIFAEYGLIRRRLAKANASLEVYELFTELWNEYQHENGGMEMRKGEYCDFENKECESRKFGELWKIPYEKWTACDTCPFNTREIDVMLEEEEEEEAENAGGEDDE